MKKLTTSGLLCLFICQLVGCSNNGIHPVSKHGLYLEGESCTVNMPFERPIQEISNDFKACITLHKHYGDKEK